MLIISTFGNRFAPWDGFASTIRTEIAGRWPGPVEFLETPLELARFAQPAEEGPFVDYIRALIQDRRLDLVITVGAPAASFVARHRAPLFESVPLLATGLDVRHMREVPPSPNQTVVAIRIDPPGIVENIQRLVPGTNRVAMVLGHSPLERFWRVQVEREFAPFAGRVQFEWLDLLPLEAMRRRVAALPPTRRSFTAPSTSTPPEYLTKRTRVSPRSDPRRVPRCSGSSRASSARASSAVLSSRSSVKESGARRSRWRFSAARRPPQ